MSSGATLWGKAQPSIRPSERPATVTTTTATTIHVMHVYAFMEIDGQLEEGWVGVWKVL